MAIDSFRDLIVWQRGIQLVVETYDISRSLPDWEQFDLGSQMRRAAVSVPSNIAEGHERRSRREYMRYLAISSGSLAELETHFTVSETVGHVQTAKLRAARGYADEVGRMIRAIERRLKRPSSNA